MSLAPGSDSDSAAASAASASSSGPDPDAPSYTLNLNPNDDGTYTVNMGTAKQFLNQDQTFDLIVLIYSRIEKTKLKPWQKGINDNLMIYFDHGELDTVLGMNGGSRSRHRRPSRKYKKSSKRVFRKKSRSTRRR